MEIFNFDAERNVTVFLAELLDKNGWEVVACHPPGGHTSFSLLDGRRSKGAYMPDVVAIKYSELISDYFVVVAESKTSSLESIDDIEKLVNFNDSHLAWLGFRLQNHLDLGAWSDNAVAKVQKIVAFEKGKISDLNIPNDFVAFKVSATSLIESQVGPSAPARELFSEKAFSNK